MRPDVVAGHGGRPPVRVRPPPLRDLHGRRRIRDCRLCTHEHNFYEGGSKLIGRALTAFEILVSAYALSELFSELNMRVFGCGVYIPRTPEHYYVPSWSGRLATLNSAGLSSSSRTKTGRTVTGVFHVASPSQGPPREPHPRRHFHHRIGRGRTSPDSGRGCRRPRIPQVYGIRMHS